MLTIKLITENTDAVIRGLEKKHFKGAKESIDKVLELNDKRRIAQNQLDKNLAEVNATSKSIGQLMKEGKKEEAEAAKKHVSEIKEVSKALQYSSSTNSKKSRKDGTILLFLKQTSARWAA